MVGHTTDISPAIPWEEACGSWAGRQRALKHNQFSVKLLLVQQTVQAWTFTV